jgi:hypothetical protein
LRNRAPLRYRGEGLIAVIETSNEMVISSFLSSPTHVTVPSTGDGAFDQVMSGFVRPQLIYKGQLTDDGVVTFEVASSAVFNEELVQQLLVPTQSSLPDQYFAHRDDGSWRWSLGPPSGSDDATAEIDFSFGWGDCFVSCVGMHKLHAVAPPDGPVTVYDMGGDPLPPDLSLSPHTIPF